MKRRGDPGGRDDSKTVVTKGGIGGRGYSKTTGVRLPICKEERTIRRRTFFVDTIKLMLGPKRSQRPRERMGGGCGGCVVGCNRTVWVLAWQLPPLGVDPVCGFLLHWCSRLAHRPREM